MVRFMQRLIDEADADRIVWSLGLNLGALMEKGIMLKGNGQAPAQLYMEKILKGEWWILMFSAAPSDMSFLLSIGAEYILPGKFDPTLILTHRFDITEMDKWAAESSLFS